MNMIAFNHYGEPVNVYFNLIGDNICDIKVTRGGHKEEGFDLMPTDIEAIADEISYVLHASTMQFENMNKAFDA